jgi:hypothetical protein
MAAKAGTNGSDWITSAAVGATRHQAEDKEQDMNKETKPCEADCDDLLGNPDALLSQEIPPGIDRRKFLIRSAVGSAAAIMTGRSLLAADRTSAAVKSIPLPL